MVPDNIRKADILKAIEDFEKNGYGKGFQHSTTYDVRYNGKAYPPKVLISLANKFANGRELKPDEFDGGINTPAFDILEREGFQIVEKDGKSPKYFIVHGHIDNEDLTDKYISRSYWNKKPGRNYEDLILSVKEGDKIALRGKANQKELTIIAIGVSRKNPGSGYYLKIDWERVSPMTIPMEEAYRKKIFQLEDQNLIKTIFYPFQNQNIKNLNKPALNIILYGPPGTGKTYNTVNQSLAIADPDFLGKHKEDREQLVRRFNELLIEDWEKPKGQIVFVTFHQSFTYEDFVEGIKPSLDGSSVDYSIEEGVFKKICDLASSYQFASDNFEETYEKFKEEVRENGKLELKTLQRGRDFTVYVNSKGNLRHHANTDKAYEGVIKKEVIKHYLQTGDSLDWPSYTSSVGEYIKDKYNYEYQKESEEKKYVIVIDEVNRGNVSSIFGELITLLEKDKRKGEVNEVSTILPYSKESFSVPSNLHIIGTMNTADRSVEALDTALRRRFTFQEVMPQPQLLQQEELDIQLPLMLQTINQRITKLIDRDHQIGHSYFLGIADAEDPELELKNVFKNCILPLLQEYFYGDYGKIGLVLGKAFVEKEEEKITFSDFEHEDKEILAEKPVYRLADPLELPLDAFRAIYEKKSD